MTITKERQRCLDVITSVPEEYIEYLQVMLIDAFDEIMIEEERREMEEYKADMMDIYECTYPDGDYPETFEEFLARCRKERGLK
ncbi:MAG: hypothetical protein FWG63_10525 [Defluviitaleaceae bacterium]|nr:hypothetical protein [Defluviitaleaceae bacterium]